MKDEKVRERLKIENLVDKIDGEVDSVIVEGTGDREILGKLGFEGKIFLSAEKNLDDLKEDVVRASNRTAVLTDFDNHGKKEAEKISHELDKDIDVVFSIRDKFGKALTSNDRRTLEELAPLFSSWQKKFVDAALDRIFFRE